MRHVLIVVGSILAMPALADTIYVCKQPGTKEKAFQDQPCEQGLEAGTLRTTEPGAPTLATTRHTQTRPNFGKIVAQQLPKAMVQIGVGATQQLPPTATNFADALKKPTP